jgi:hypothetical protein
LLVVGGWFVEALVGCWFGIVGRSSTNVPLLVVGGWFVEALVACQLSMVGCWFGIAGRCWVEYWL